MSSHCPIYWKHILYFCGLSTFYPFFHSHLLHAASYDRDGSRAYAQAEWFPPYDADTVNFVQRSSLPLLSLRTVSETEKAIAHYESIVAQGGWQKPLPLSGVMKLGHSGDSVLAVRERLALAGDLTVPPRASHVFDSYVVSAVRQFQTRHGLKPTGELDALTLEALNVPAEKRLHQLKLNLGRLKNGAADAQGDYVVINIPAAAMETVQNGAVVTRHDAGVGKADRQSPLMKAPLVAVNFNPYWTVPPSIVRKDLIKRMQENPNYLTEHRIRVYMGNKELSPESINWNTNEATQYTFRQDPGARINSLGFVRVNVQSAHGVYIHDTPERGIFGENYRFISSGCVRVQNVRDYVAFLLKDNPDWNRLRINQVIESGERLDVTLKRPILSHWVYITAWGSENGLVNFRNDVYHKDGL
jgi:murein L,D-transpeptidase YcbB/YkuD